MIFNAVIETIYYDKTVSDCELLKKIENWLIGKSLAQRQPIYKFLAVMCLVNLSRFNGLDLSKVWQKNILQHSFKVFRIPIILNNDTCTTFSPINASPKNAYPKNDVAADEAMAAYNAVFSIVSTANEVATNNSIDVSYQILESYLKTYDIAHEVFYDDVYDITNTDTEMAAIDAYRKALSKVNPISSLWDYFVEDNKDPEIKKHCSNFLDEIHPFVMKSITLLNTIHLDFIYKDLKIVTDNLFNKKNNKLAEWRSKSYLKNLDTTAFTSPEQLKNTVYGETHQVHVRVLIVGSGGSGKTTLFQLLSGRNVEAFNTATNLIGQSNIKDAQCSGTSTIISNMILI